MDNRFKHRCGRLNDLGLMWNGDSYVKDDINVHWTEITCETDEGFNKIVSTIETELERRK